jgi:serine/threonine-protein kinase
VLDVGSPTVRARLVQEGRVQAQLRHPNVVMVTDLVDVGGSPGLIMEYVPGPTLEVWLRANRPDPEVAARIFDGVLDAVTFAHENGLVHRDLKPGNVLLETVNGRLHAKVTDFGLAKVLGPEGAGRTRSGFAMGTPGYMAPE